MIDSVKEGCLYKSSSQTVHFHFAFCLPFLPPFNSFSLLLQSQLLRFRHNNDYHILSPRKIVIKKSSGGVTHETGTIQNAIRTNKISEGKCHISHFDTCAGCCVTLSFYTHHSQLYTGKQHSDLRCSQCLTVRRQYFIHSPRRAIHALTSGDAVRALVVWIDLATSRQQHVHSWLKPLFTQSALKILCHKKNVI